MPILDPPTPTTDHAAGGRRRLLLVLVAATVVVAACGADDDGSTAGTQAFEPADVAFAQGMVPHHEQAIEMSDLALSQAESTEVKALALRIKGAQQPEIDQMKGWLSEWEAEGAPSDDHGGHGGGHGDGAMGMLSATELEALRNAGGADFDKLFLEGMIRHHEGAVGMAETELVDGRHEGARELARRIIESQKAEIAEMRGLLAG